VPSPWFAPGLDFECTRCGRCCTGAGTVRVTQDEVDTLARELDLERTTFLERYTRTLPDGELSLIDRANDDCVFFDREQGCTVYAARPKQCRSWPFWRANLATREHWDSASSSCPGMNHGPRFEEETIRRTAADDGTSGIVPDLVEWTWPG